MLKYVLTAAALIISTIGFAQTLHVYGPGGPLAPIKECAALYTQQTHKTVLVTAGPETSWFPAAQTDADIIYGGAEYMLTQFDQQHPGFLQAGSRAELYTRPIGILVRKGNPKHILVLSDLSRSGVKILDVNGAGQVGVLEDLAGREHLIGSIQQHVAISVTNSADAIRQWNADPTLDAWVTYASWQKRLPDSTDFVQLSQVATLHRGTPIAIAARSQQSAAAAAFLIFLHTDEAHAIFQKWGWD